MNTEKAQSPLERKSADSFEAKKKLLSQSELSIWLDGYADVFSDFDSRPYTERTLSDDFINEAKKIAREKPGGSISLKLLMPEKLRDHATEQIIVKSLHTYFRKTAEVINNEIKKNRRKGFLFIAVGAIIIMSASYLFQLQYQNFLFNTIRVLLEPAGWFFTWTGFDNVFYSSRGKKSEYAFAAGMAHADITFLSF